MSPFATGSSAVHSIRVGWMFKMETLGDMPNGLLHYYIIHDLSDSEESLVSPFWFLVALKLPHISISPRPQRSTKKGVCNPFKGRKAGKELTHRVGSLLQRLLHVRRHPISERTRCRLHCQLQ